MPELQDASVKARPPAAAPPSPRFLRILLWAWLGFQAVLLALIIATHGPGMEPDLRLASGAAMVMASFPLSLLTMYASLQVLETFSGHGLLFNGLVTWAGCFVAGAFQLWLATVLARRFRAPARSQEDAGPR